MIRSLTLAVVILGAACAPSYQVAAFNGQSVAIDRHVGFALQRSFDMAQARCGGPARFRYTENINGFQDRDHYECVR